MKVFGGGRLFFRLVSLAVTFLHVSLCVGKETSLMIRKIR